ncbi:MAG TPA: hypothetical protein V6D50_13490 [Chroococcales cyanobacterium]|jgi:hypothetical protein
MLTDSNNIMQEEWVQRWLEKLTPKQQALVVEILGDLKKPQNLTPAAIAQANAVTTNSDPIVARSSFTAVRSNLSGLMRSAS